MDNSGIDFDENLVSLAVTLGVLLRALGFRRLLSEVCRAYAENPGTFDVLDAAADLCGCYRVAHGLDDPGASDIDVDSELYEYVSDQGAIAAFLEFVLYAPGSSDELEAVTVTEQVLAVQHALDSESPGPSAPVH